jgi:hypothetical protein
MFGGVGSSRPALPPGQEAAPPADADVKRVSFRARAKSKRQVAQARCAYLLRPVALPDALDRARGSLIRCATLPAPQAASERLFCDYLALPAEEYSLLDPRWVSRIDDCTFRFTVPLGAVLSELSQSAPVPGGLLKLEPAITVRTELERDVRRVTLRGSDATLGLAGSGLERGFSLGFTTTMTWSGGPAEGAAADPAAPPWGLACAVEVQGSLGLGPPLAKLPGPILGAFISLLGTAVAQAVLPRFAETLAEDYARWAVGKDRFSSSGALLGVGSSSDGDSVVDIEPLAAPEPPAAEPSDASV